MRGDQNAERLREITTMTNLSSCFDIGNSCSPIIPILIGDDMRTILTWKMLLDNGVFVNPVISPAVPAGQQLLRTSYMATLTDQQLDQVLEVFGRVGKAMGLIA
jgi:7-keto-8-aminopelargonate synthetase-like enzyme